MSVYLYICISEVFDNTVQFPLFLCHFKRMFLRKIFNQSILIAQKIELLESLYRTIPKEAYYSTVQDNTWNSTVHHIPVSGEYLDKCILFNIGTEQYPE